MDTEVSGLSAGGLARSDRIPTDTNVTSAASSGGAPWALSPYLKALEIQVHDKRGFTTEAAPPFDPARLRVTPSSARRSASGAEIQCGRFRLLPHCRVLLRDGRRVDLGGRAFDLMQVLMSSPGAVISKDDIVKRVWPTTLVEECNLRFQVAALRKALGADRDLIKAVRGRGYLFAVDGSAFGSGRSDEDGPWIERETVNRPGSVHHGEAQQKAEHQSLGGLSLVVDRAPDSYETLRELLRSVLEELRRLTPQPG